jgi:hypothetical protein
MLDRPRGLTIVERVWSNPTLIERWSAGSTQCLCHVTMGVRPGSLWQRRGDDGLADRRLR